MHLLLNRYNRVIYNDNGSYTDYTKQMRSWDDTKLVSFVLTQDEDFIYVGMPHTFASRFIRVKTANTNAATLKVELYENTTNGWVEVKNLMDETNDGGIPFAKSGFLMWDPNFDRWTKTQINDVPDLLPNQAAGDGRGYYWARISSDTTLSTTEIDWLGLIWTTQEYMQVIWRECLDAKYLPSGQTDWYEEIEMATGDVADDLNIKKVIDYEMQAKDTDELGKLTAYKCLINILTPMVTSEALARLRNSFKNRYDKLLTKRLGSIDGNKDEKINDKEKKPYIDNNLRRV